MSNAIELNEKQVNNIIKSLNSDIEKIKKEFYAIRDEASMSGFSEKAVLQKYNAIMRIDDTQVTENDINYIVKSVKIISKNHNKLLYEIRYGSNGLTIIIGDDKYREGIYLVKFSDFTLNKLTELMYTKKLLDRYEYYIINMSPEGVLTGEYKSSDRRNVSFLGAIVLKIRKAFK